MDGFSVFDHSCSSRQTFYCTNWSPSISTEVEGERTKELQKASSDSSRNSKVYSWLGVVHGLIGVGISSLTEGTDSYSCLIRWPSHLLTFNKVFSTKLSWRPLQGFLGAFFLAGFWTSETWFLAVMLISSTWKMYFSLRYQPELLASKVRCWHLPFSSWHFCQYRESLWSRCRSRYAPDRKVSHFYGTCALTNKWKLLLFWRWPIWA